MIAENSENINYCIKFVAKIKLKSNEEKRKKRSIVYAVFYIQFYRIPFVCEDSGF